MRRLLTCFLLVAALWPVQAFAAGDGTTEAVKPDAKDHPLKEIWSGYHYSSPEIRKLQDSDSDNPAMKLYGKGEALWKKIEGRANKSCSSCHGEASKSMKGAATRFPAYFKLSKKPITIEARINLCRAKFMQARPLPSESEPLLALAIYVKRQSKGMAMSVTGEGPLEAFLRKGKDYYTARRGQLDTSCAACHDKYAGKRYRAVKMSQGHANGFPAYSQGKKKTGSLLRQVNQCLARLRATPLKAGSDQLANLELYLAWRASGLEIETPAVRE
jgi:sulfur-oxidizing protein SoxA